MIFDGILNQLGWVIFHSLWQITLVVGVARVLLFFISKDYAALRHNIYFSALTVSALLMIGTAVYQIEFGAKEQFVFQIERSVNIEKSDVQEFGSEGSLATQILIMLNSHSSWVAAFWVLGVFIISLKHGISYYFLQKLRRKGLASIPFVWQERLMTLIKQSGIKREVRCRFSKFVESPMTMGFLKPIILVPVGFFAELSPTQIEAILLHELAHIKRNDYVLNLIQTIISTLLFYHPAIWFLNSQIKIERENACDDFAFSRSNEGISLAKALGLLQIRNSKTQNKMAMYLFNKKSSVMNRMQRLMSKKAEANGIKYERKSLWVPAMVLFLGLVLVSFNFTSSMKGQPEIQNDNNLALVAPDTTKPAPVLPSLPSTEVLQVVDENLGTVLAEVETDISVAVAHDIDVDVAVTPLPHLQEVDPVYKISADGGVEVVSSVNESPFVMVADTLIVGKSKDKKKTKDKAATKQKAKDKEWTEREQAEYEAQRQALRVEKEKLAAERLVLLEERKRLEMERREMLMDRKQRDLERSERDRERGELRREEELEALEAREALEQLEMAEMQAMEQLEMAKAQRNEAEQQRELAKLQQLEAKQMALMKQQEMLALQRIEVEKLEAFRSELIKELKKDGLWQSQDRSLEIKFPNKKISINGKLIPKNLQSKYKKLFDKHGFEQKDGHTISIGE